jgi:hypothetical protein
MPIKAFAKIATPRRLAGSKNRGLFHGLCGWFEMTFEPEQRRAVLRIIDKIEKDVDRDPPFYSLL